VCVCVCVCMSRIRIGKTKGKETAEGFSRLGISRKNVFRSFVSALPPATSGQLGPLRQLWQERLDGVCASTAERERERVRVIKPTLGQKTREGHIPVDDIRDAEPPRKIGLHFYDYQKILLFLFNYNHINPILNGPSCCRNP
jgi:hypothetical protein